MDITGHTEVCWTAFHMSFVVYLSAWAPMKALASCACCVVRVLLYTDLGCWERTSCTLGLSEGPSLGYWGGLKF